MRKFKRPRIICSKCIEFAPCRYNGLIIRSSVVENLKKHADFKPVCPEVKIGLGIPRDPVRVVKIDGNPSLYQPATRRNLTKKMNEFSESFLNNINSVDGFILKNKSPSCGIKNVRAYEGIGNQASKRNGVGLFAQMVINQFPCLPLEDEGRLRNLAIRENFFTKIFTLAGFREITDSGDFNDLLEFHTQNKFLLLSYNQVNMRKMGRILSNRHKKTLEDLKEDYGKLLLSSLSGSPKISTTVNVLMHSLGFFSQELSSPEKTFFLDSLQKYRAGRIPLLVNLNLIKSWIIRFGEDYLEKQTFFSPYPEDMMQISFIYDKMGK